MSAAAALALTLLCAPLQAQQPPAVSTAAAADIAPSVEKIKKDLRLLQEREAEIPVGRINALAPELEKFDLEIRKAIGEDILNEVAAREKAEEDHRRTLHAVGLLQAFRAALQIYYGEHGGKYPAALSDLIPDYMSGVPTVMLPEHESTAAVTEITSKRYDRNYPKAVADTGGWLYFSDPRSRNYGLLLLDCSHASPEGLKFYEY